MLPENVIPELRQTVGTEPIRNRFVAGDESPLITQDLFPVKQDLLKPHEVVEGVLMPLKTDDEVPSQLIQGVFIVEWISETGNQMTLHLQRVEDGRTRTWGPMTKADWKPLIGEKLEIRTLRPTGPPTWTRTMLIDPNTHIGRLD